MVLNLIKYPDSSIRVNSGPVRSFGESFKQMKEDIIDTMKEHNLDALSATEIGYFYQLMVIKIDNEYKSFSNPRVITQKNPFLSKEQTPYLHNLVFEVQRNKTLSIVYDDESGNMQTFKIDNEDLAAKFLRTSDYLFNTILIDRLKPQEKDAAFAALAGKGEMPSFSDTTCPTESKKDYFISFADKLLFFMFISILLPLFNISKDTLSSWYTYDKIAFGSIWLLLIGFFIYSQYEAKQYKQCTSCQIGNQIGFIVKRGVANIALFTLAYFILG